MRPDARELVFTGADHGFQGGEEMDYQRSLSIEEARRPEVMLVYEMNGAPLQPQHGFPVRLVVPHLYSWKGPKWFRGWEYLPVLRRGFWEERGYHLRGDPWREERYSF